MPSPLQGIFPTQESNLRLLHYRWILYPLSHLGSLGHSSYFLNDCCICTWAISEEEDPLLNPASSLSTEGTVIDITLVEHIRGRHARTPAVVWCQRSICCRLWLEKLWNSPSFAEVYYIFHIKWIHFFMLPKMWYMGKTSWKVSCVYRILVTVCFSDLYAQVRTWAPSGEQLQMTHHAVSH